MKFNDILSATLLLSLFIACNHKEETKMDAMTISSIKEENISDDKPQYYAADSVVKPEELKKQKGITKQDVPAPDWDKKIIKNATLELEVKEGNAFYKNLREQVKNHGGYIAQEDQSETEYKLGNSLVIKVPVDQFENAVAILSDKVEKVHQRKISSEDVTGEIIDTRSRMEAKKQVRLRYLELLNQARNMTDILSVQSEINGIQEEIESAAGRVQYLGHTAAYSTIRLTYFQVLNEKAKEDVSPSFGNRVLNSFKQGGKWVVELFIGLVAIWPLLLTGVITVILLRKTIRKKTTS